MANPNGNVNNLVHTLTVDELQKGGIHSGEARRKKALIRDSLTKILQSGFKLPTEVEDTDIKNLIKKLNAVGIDTKKMELIDLINCGQILGAIGGKADNYRMLLESNGELAEKEEEIKATPTLQIELVDNSNLEKTLYEENKHSKNDGE